MKGNKKILVVALLLLLISVSFTTYAIYRTSMDGTGSANAAAWNVVFKKGSTVASSNLDFTGSDVTWTVNPSAVAGKIAPGATGYIDFTVDASGSEVDVYYSATLGASATSGISVTMKDSNDTEISGEQLISYATGANAMAATVRVYVSWDGATSDTTEKDTTDKGMATAAAISIPITLTARQSVTNKTGTGT